MTTMSIAVLLAAGLLAAKMCQRWRLPSITAYVLAGLLLAPAVLIRPPGGSEMEGAKSFSLVRWLMP